MRLRINLSVPQSGCDRLIYISFISSVVLNLKMLWLLVLFLFCFLFSVHYFFFFFGLMKTVLPQFQNNNSTRFMLRSYSSVFVILYLLTTSPYTEPCICRTELETLSHLFAVYYMYSMVDFSMTLPGVSLGRTQFKEFIYGVTPTRCE